MSNFFDVTDKTIIVAGACGGLGSAIAAMLASEGARLVLADLATKWDSCEASTPTASQCERVTADLTDERDVEALMAETIRVYGKLDAVVNATGVLPIAAAADTTVDVFRACMDLNVTAAFNLTRHAASHMHQVGSIVHLASVSSTVANPHYAAYASSKAALAQLVRVLAREYATSGIRVNAIGPALVETPLTSAYLSDPEFLENALSAIPMGRLCKAEDLFATVLLLLGSGGSFITGQTIYVDGGRTLV